MASFRTFDDIQRERIEKEHQDMKDKIVKDTTEIISKVGDNLRKEKEKRKSLFKIVLYFGFGFALFLFCLNLILLNIWILRWVIKSLFFG